MDLILVICVVESSEFLEWVYATMSYLQRLRTGCWYIRPNPSRLIVLFTPPPRLSRLRQFIIRVINTRPNFFRENELISHLVVSLSSHW
jgi:hypothetical protein